MTEAMEIDALVDAPDESAAPRRGRPSPLSIGVVALLNGLWVLPGIWTALYHPDRWTGPTDHLIHAEWVKNTFAQPWSPGIPHFGFHLMVRAVTLPFQSQDFRPGALFVLVVLSGAFGALLYAYFYNAMSGWTGRWVVPVSAALSLAIAGGEAPTALFGWSYEMPPAFFLPLNMPHSPTSLGGRVFAFALFLMVVRTLQGEDRWVRWLIPAAVASTFFKPFLSPTLALVAMVWALVHLADDDGRARARLMLTRVVIPVGVCLVIQMVMPYPEVAAERERSIIFRPFHDLLMMDGGNPLFWTTLLFPIVAFLLFRGRIRSLEVTIALWCFAVSMLIVSTLSMTGGVPYAADFLHFPQISALVVSITILAQLLRMAPSFDHADRVRLMVLGGVVGIYALAGASLWACQGTSACLVH